MTDTTYKLTTLVGESTDGIESAVTTALGTSTGKVHGQQWIQVKDIRASVGDDGTVDRWQVEVEVAFEVDPA